MSLPSFQMMTEDEARKITERIRAAAREFEAASWAHHREVGAARRVASDCLYLMQMGDAGPVKIGVASDVESRRRGLQTASPYPIRIRYTLPGRAGRERELHRRFGYFRLEGEWFEPIPEIFEWFRMEAI